MRILKKFGVNDVDESAPAKYYVELAGDSLDAKPTDMIADGSVLLETDTGNLYVFSEASSDWIYTKNVKGEDSIAQESK